MVEAHPHFRWIRPALQARSHETLERLLDSAEALIAEKGFDDVPVAEIARRAGMSVGAVYSRLRDKEALLHCLQERLVTEARATADAALDPKRWRGASIAEIAEELVAFLVEIHRERVGVLREILGRAHSDPEIDARKEGLIAYICERLRPLLLERADEIGHPHPAVAGSFAFRLVLGFLKEAILFGGLGAHGIPRSDKALCEELTRAFLGYLGASNPQPS
jgi:AcrR family transcriptional regulator